MDVLVNGRFALRVTDKGVHAACCGTNMWEATAGSATVFINGKSAHRQGDTDKHCGGTGRLIEGSPNVITGGTSTDGGAGEAASRRGPRSDGAGGGTAGGPHGTSAGGGTVSGTGASPASGGSGTSPAGTAPAGEDKPQTLPPDRIEVAVTNALDQPASGVFYELRLPDGSVRTGMTDGGGKIIVENIAKPGACTLVFPDIDAQQPS